MAVSVVPAVCAALMTVAESQCPTAGVYYAVIDDDATGDAFVINATELSDGEWQDAAASAREWESVGRLADINETGEIPCVIRAWSGNGGSDGQLEVMQAAYALAEAFGTYLRTDTTALGVTGLQWVLFGSDVQLRHRADPQTGSQAELAFSVYFQALI